MAYAGQPAPGAPAYQQPPAPVAAPQAPASSAAGPYATPAAASGGGAGPYAATPAAPAAQTPAVGAKRPYDESEANQGTPKRQKSAPTGPQLHIRGLVRGTDAGAIIGAGGCKITAVRTGTGCEVKISKGGPKRILDIKGPQSSCVEALGMIIDTMSAENPPDAKAYPHAPTPPVAAFNMLIAEGLGGWVIGKGGKMIREIRDASRADVNMENELMGTSDEKMIQISGSSAECVKIAVEKIIDSFAEKFHPPRRPYLPGLSDTSWNAGGGYNTSIPSIAQAGFHNMGMHPYGMPPPHMMGPHGGPPMGPHGGPQGGWNTTQPGVSPITTQINMMSQNIHYALQGIQHTNPNVFLVAQQISVLANSRELIGQDGSYRPDVTVEFNVPRNLSGGIIGKGGSTISSIRNQSHASIKIDDSADRSIPMRHIRVSGPGASCALACCLIANAIITQANH